MKAYLKIKMNSLLMDHDTSNIYCLFYFSPCSYSAVACLISLHFTSHVTMILRQTLNEALDILVLIKPS